MIGGELRSNRTVPSADGSHGELADLLARLEHLEVRVGREIDRRRTMRGNPDDDPYRGLYVSDEMVDELLDDVIGVAESGVDTDAPTAADATREAATSRMARLAQSFSLDALDLDILLLAAAPSLDRRFEPLYGYLNDDVSLRHATVGLAFELLGCSPLSRAARMRCSPSGPLVQGGLVNVGSSERPFLTRSLVVPDRVVAHLLGDDTPADELQDVMATTRPTDGEDAVRLAGVLGTGAPLVHLRDATDAGAFGVVAAAAALLGREVLLIDSDRFGRDIDVGPIVRAAAREARLRDAVLAVGPVAGMGDLDVRTFAECGSSIVLTSRRTWNPVWSRDVPVTVEVHRLDTDAMAERWEAVLGMEVAHAVDAAGIGASLRLSTRHIERAAEAATRQAAAEDRAIAAEDLRRGVRSQNAAGLARLARRIEPSATWDDLVVPRRIETELRSVTTRWRHRDRVLGDFKLGGGQLRGRGVSALFAGASGTGKTMSAEVIAGDLGLDLYIVDLSTVVDKYIGETSKNLERIFDEADRVNGVLLFDEADALFGKRSAVSDAKDRHANVEVAFLLQRMESFDGVAILTTNLAANLDDAFLRRLDTVVDFPSPDARVRARLWATMLGRGVPRAPDVDLDDLAERFELSGSEIRNVIITAAHEAVDRGPDAVVTHEDLVRAVVREHRKLGRHLTASALGPHAHLLEDPR